MTSKHRYGVAIYLIGTETFATYKQAKAFLDRIPHKAHLMKGSPGDPFDGEILASNNGREPTEAEKLAAIRLHMDVKHF